jgi:hypothetical protein
MTHQTKRPRGPEIEEGDILRDQNAPTILSPWEHRGQSGGISSASPVNTATSAELPSEHASDACFDKASLARFLDISYRSLDRAWAARALPEPDFWFGRSPRWLPESIRRWLKTRPRLPGRGGRR